jgi:hypothetical protein
MENGRYTEFICKRFCSFYKPGKEIIGCGSYAFLRANLSVGELRRVAEETAPGFDLSEDSAVRELLCDRCDFAADGCDFRHGLASPPCGGYSIVRKLVKG